MKVFPQLFYKNKHTQINNLIGRKYTFSFYHKFIKRPFYMGEIRECFKSRYNIRKAIKIGNEMEYVLLHIFIMTTRLYNMYIVQCICIMYYNYEINTFKYAKKYR